MAKVKTILIFGVSLLVLSFLVFTLSRLAPIEPLRSYYGERVERMSAEDKDAARAKLGLDRSLLTQYGLWLKQASRGEFGISFKYKEDALKVMADRLGNTLILGGVSFVGLIIGSLSLGTLSAWHEGGRLDKWLRRLGTLSSAVPEFWLALLFIFIFSVTFKLLPSSGAYDVGRDTLLGRGVHLILPASVLILSHLGYYSYFVRNRMLEEFKKDYILLSRAQGMSRRAIVFGLCLRSVVPSYLSLMMVSLGHILTGTYTVEMVFSYPGIGSLAYESAQFGDYNVLMLVCLFSGTLVMGSSTLASTCNRLLDPRFKRMRRVR
ncbi:ABC transporter permease [Peptoniphilus equinus]|uniref:ABC transporter permease n=1 Tax=Peptoniphilus equinus TaxID=3016343 RepID=A0ABY7QSR9_9FIRM|nr:ABC transporter permease [Peptoniphilus equinus]WBW49335.1 ABC transporter permease [Peptoniphilus equinus]